MPALFLLLALLASSLVPAPAAAAVQQDPSPPRVYLDCSAPGCDFDFFRTELQWVDWLRDRQDADVHVIITSQPTGGGGRQYDVSFQGRGELEDNQFTLLHSSTALRGGLDIEGAIDLVTALYTYTYPYTGPDPLTAPKNPSGSDLRTPSSPQDTIGGPDSERAMDCTLFRDPLALRPQLV